MITDDPGTPDPATPDSDAPDPRRWITLGIILTAVVLASIDATVLNVAVPTMLVEFDTTLPTLQWVIAGYTLTFAALLIIGGRLADIFGSRKIFIVGAALFGVGSFVASISPNVATLVIGEAVIEGMGASMMIPATMGILSSTFTGRERGIAFGIWGGAMGAAVAFGPVFGGYLTSYHSWRWAFRLNALVVPLAIVGALAFMPKVIPTGRRPRIDIPGALLIATGMFLLVFSISEGATYGWWEPQQTLTIFGVDLWPASMPISIVPVTFALAGLQLFGFYRLERIKEREDRDPLFAFSQLQIPTFRWGLSTLVLMAMGQIAFMFVCSMFLQSELGLSPIDTGLWLVPSGVFIVVGSQVGARLTNSIGTTKVVRIGLVLEAAGLAIAAWAAAADATFWQLLPAFAAFGTGVGFAASQLTNVVLSGISLDKVGSASGANTTVRMIGSSLGIAVISAVLTSASARPALLFASSMAALGAIMSLRIPDIDGAAKAVRSIDVTDKRRHDVTQESEAVAETYAVP